MKLSLTIRLGAAHAPFLRRLLRRAAPLLPRALDEVSFVLVNDAEMSRLHARFLNIAGPTDVLTFELDHDARGRCVAGEVIVCVPEARRRGKAEGQPVERELLLYCLHGMLHLCGLDDRTERGFRLMHRTEDKILTRLGIGPVFGKTATAVPKTGPRGDRKRPARRRRSRSVGNRQTL